MDDQGFSRGGFHSSAATLINTMETIKIRSVSGIYFSWAGKMSAWADCMLLVAAVIEIVDMIWDEKLSGLHYWDSILVIEALLLALFAMLSLGGSIANFLARKKKINDVVDNAFGTKIGDSHSDNYFDNEDINTGTKKLLYNTAESCFFSYNEMKSMACGVSVKTMLPFVIFAVGLVLNKAEVIMAIFRISAIMVLVIQALQFFVTLMQLQVLQSNMFATLKHKVGNTAQFNAECINYTLEYETVMVWYGTKIPDKVYRKLNEKLTNEWEGFKKTFVVK